MIKINNVDKIFIVKCSCGSWDFYHSWVGGVFSSYDNAASAINELNMVAEHIRALAPPQNDDEDLLSDDYIDYYMKPENKNYEEWNKPIIEEYVIDMLIV